MNDYIRLYTIFEDDITNGLFTALNNFNVPWKDAVSSTDLNVAFYNHSGQKIISNVVNHFLDDTNRLTSDGLDKLCSTLVSVYGKNWSKLYNTLDLDYNPINNYDMTEESEDNETNTGTNTDVKTGYDTSKATADTNALVYGFNSATGVNSNDNKSTTDQSVTYNTTNTDTINHTTTNKHKLTRSGNIGVTTSQQMIQAERDLWLWYYFDAVFDDIDKLLTLRIY